MACVEWGAFVLCAPRSMYGNCCTGADGCDNGMDVPGNASGRRLPVQCGGIGDLRWGSGPWEKSDLAPAQNCGLPGNPD